MKWAKAKDKDGNVLERVAISDAGYKVARFTIDGKDQYRASLQGEFLHFPVPDPKEAQAVCERHYLITGAPSIL